MNTEREAFEAYQNSIGASTSKNNDGKYFSETANAAWMGWQAALANKPEAVPMACYTKTYGVQMLKAGFLADLPNNTLLYTSPPSTAALQKRIEELEADQPLPEQFYLNYIRTLQSALKRLSFAAQTSGGTAGKDDELMAAIEQAGEALKFKTAAQAYGDVQAPKEGWKMVPIEPTREMINAAQERAARHRVADMKLTGGNDQELSYGATYKAMIAAAPTDTEGK